MPELPILDELREELHAAYLAAEERELAPPPRRSGPRRRWLLPAGSLVVTAVIVALISGLGAGTVAPPPATAREALHRAAENARTRPSDVPAGDGFYYVNSLATNLSQNGGPGPRDSRLVTVERESWTSLTRPGRLVEHVHGARAASAPAPRSASLGPVRYYLLGNERLSRAALLAYPTDPQAIIDRLSSRYEDGQGGTLENELFVWVGDALREQPAPPALRAGLYEALALIPRVTFVGKATDRAGRTGLAVAQATGFSRRELLFDPDTSELLAERERLLDPAKAQIDLPAGTLITDTSYLARAATTTTEAP
ncbi:MAG: CU044_5270 family protein [Solirubrobacteraceae bacterium]